MKSLDVPYRESIESLSNSVLEEDIYISNSVLDEDTTISDSVDVHFDE